MWQSPDRGSQKAFGLTISSAAADEMVRPERLPARYRLRGNWFSMH